MDYLGELLKSGDDFNSNFWEVEISGFSNSVFRIESSTLPFIKFTVEELPTGEKYFSEVVHPGEFSLVIREASDLSVRAFFKEWQDGFYKDGVFIAQGENVEIGSEADKIHRTISFRLLKHKLISVGSFSVDYKEIDDNLLFAKARSVVDKVGAIIKNRPTGTVTPPPTREASVVTGQAGNYEEETLKTFNMIHVKLLGFDPISFDYSTGEALKYNVSFTCDYIDEDDSI